MNPKEPLSIRRLKSQPKKLSAAELKIDAEAGIIYNVIMCSVGEAKGHGFWLEQEFIDDLVKYDVRNFSKIGLKSRFDHPAMCDGTMGTQLGIYKNFRVEGENAVADLYLLASADQSPTHPGMRQWVLSMAAERPDFIMSSIVFKPGRYYQKDSGGAKLYVYEYDKEDNYVYPNSQLGNVFVEFGKAGQHFYTDLVEAGAATETLYSAHFNGQSFAVRAVEWLGENPDIQDFVKNNPDALREFLAKAGIDLTQISNPKPRKMKSLKSIMQEWLGKVGTDDDEDLFKRLSEADKKFTELSEQVANLTKSLSEATAKVESLGASIAEKDKTLAERDARIAELESEAAANHTEGATESEPPSGEERPMSEFTKRAIERFSKKRPS